VIILQPIEVRVRVRAYRETFFRSIVTSNGSISQVLEMTMCLIEIALLPRGESGGGAFGMQARWITPQPRSIYTSIL
jgi:hypothetical protein